MVVGGVMRRFRRCCGLAGCALALAAPALAQEQACAFSGALAHPLGGTYAIELRLAGGLVQTHDVPAANVTLTLDAEAGTAHAAVRGPVEFDGVVDRVAAWPVGPIEVAGGILRLPRQVVRAPRQVGPDAVSAQVDWGGRSYPVTFRCDLIQPVVSTARRTELRGMAAHLAFARRDWWEVREGELVFRSGPGFGETLRVAPPAGEPRVMQHLEHRDGFVRLALAWADGTRLRGWVSREDAWPWRPPPPRRGLRSRGIAGPTVRAEWLESAPPPRPWLAQTAATYVGAIVVRADARIYDGRGGVAWAHVTEDVGAMARLSADDRTWAQVWSVAGWGVAGYVLRSELVLPAEVRASEAPVARPAPGLRRPLVQ